jgi:hypothetical protein
MMKVLENFQKELLELEDKQKQFIEQNPYHEADPFLESRIKAFKNAISKLENYKG